MIKNHPFFGIGIGNYSGEYDKYFDLAWDRYFNGNMQHAHNLFLNITAEVGILGLIWVISLMAITIFYGISIMKRKYNRKIISI